MLGVRAAGAVIALSALPATGAHAADETPWRCWYNAPEHITCARPPELAGSRYLHIPLHTVPFDLRHVEALARAIVCGSTAVDCGMQFTARAPIDELDRMMDPLLASLD
jgi:hypothetical protein